MTSRDPGVRVPSRVTRVRGLTLKDQGSSLSIGTVNRRPGNQVVPLTAGHTSDPLTKNMVS
jgi:hypothetical protein